MRVHFGNAFADVEAVVVMNGDDLSDIPRALESRNARGQQTGTPVLHGSRSVGVDGDFAAHGGGKGKPASLARHARTGQEKSTDPRAAENFIQNAGRLAVGDDDETAGVHGNFRGIEF